MATAGVNEVKSHKAFLYRGHWQIDGFCCCLACSKEIGSTQVCYLVSARKGLQTGESQPPAPQRLRVGAWGLGEITAQGLMQRSEWPQEALRVLVTNGQVRVSHLLRDETIWVLGFKHRGASQSWTQTRNPEGMVALSDPTERRAPGPLTHLGPSVFMC